MSLYEAAFELKDYCVQFTFRIRTEERQVPKHVWLVSCKHTSVRETVNKNRSETTGLT